jgi:hypothetical protein
VGQVRHVAIDPCYNRARGVSARPRGYRSRIPDALNPPSMGLYVMQVIQRFNITVTTATVIVMFGIIEFLLPTLQASTLPTKLSQYFPSISPATLAETTKLIVTPLATLGTYTLLAKMLGWVIGRVPLLKRLIFGPVYVEGTWVGRFTASNQARWTIECFEQNLDGVVIRGQARNSNGTIYATWTTSSVAVDPDKGELTYSYECDLTGTTFRQQGIGFFHFERESSAKPPHRIEGYSVDVTNGERSPNTEMKISDRAMSSDEAFTRARQLFP